MLFCSPRGRLCEHPIATCFLHHLDQTLRVSGKAKARYKLQKSSTTDKALTRNRGTRLTHIINSWRCQQTFKIWRPASIKQPPTMESIFISNFYNRWYYTVGFATTSILMDNFNHQKHVLTCSIVEATSPLVRTNNCFLKPQTLKSVNLSFNWKQLSQSRGKQDSMIHIQTKEK